MQEMDILLLRYLEKGWPGASPSEREDFERLLETEDDVLWDWLISREQPSDPRLACLVEGILRLPPH
jgi:antitoxin CptB